MSTTVCKVVFYNDYWWNLEFMFTKFSVAIWNLLASTKAELCAKLDCIVSASWDFTFLFTYDFADNKGVKSTMDMYKTDLQLYFLDILIL